MKMWWKAVCDEHKEMCDVFVNNIETTAHFLMRHNSAINDWMWTHRGCKLRLVYHDQDLDECFKAGCKVVDLSKVNEPEPLATLVWDGIQVDASFVCVCGVEVSEDIGVDFNTVECPACCRVWRVGRTVRVLLEEQAEP